MTSVTSSFRQFAYEHDDIPAFHAANLVATFLVAALLNLGYFAVVIGLHMMLDYFKYRDVHGYSIPVTLKAILLESITDIAFFLVALTSVVYLSHTYLLEAVSGLFRSELTLLRAAGTILPKVRIVEDTMLIIFNFHHYLHTPHPDLNRPITRVQHWSFLTVFTCVLLLLCSLVLYHGHMDTLEIILKREFTFAL